MTTAPSQVQGSSPVSTPGTNNGSPMIPSNTPAKTAVAHKLGRNLEFHQLIREFQSKLGPKWDKYSEILSAYLIGRLSRAELLHSLKPILSNQQTYKLHNKLLLLNLANSINGNSPANNSANEITPEFSIFWNRRQQTKSKNVRSSQYEKFKLNIMGLSIRERRRIKSITRDGGKKGKLNAFITLTRHALLPKIPMIQDKDQQLLQISNIVQWQQDVVNGINAPVATENYELPDYDLLLRRILMTMREHGLTGGLNPQVLEMVMLGLESHLKNLMESAIDTIRYRETKYAKNDILPTANNEQDKETGSDGNSEPIIEIPESKKPRMNLSIEDMYDTFEIFPYLIEPLGPKLRLSTVMLANEDQKDLDETDYILPPKPASLLLENGTGSSIKSEDKKTGDTNGAARPNEHIGTTDELKWVLHDLVSTM